MSLSIAIAALLTLLKWRSIVQAAIGAVKFVGYPLFCSLYSFLRSAVHLTRYLLAPLAVWFIVSPDTARSLTGDLSAPLTIFILIGAAISILCAVTTGLRTAVSVSFVLALSLIVIMKSNVTLPNFNISKEILIPKKKVQASKRDELEYIDFTKKREPKRSTSDWLDDATTVNVAAVQEKVTGFLSDDLSSFLNFNNKNKFNGLSDNHFFPRKEGKKQYYGFSLDDSPEQTFSFSSLAKYLN